MTEQEAFVDVRVSGLCDPSSVSESEFVRDILQISDRRNSSILVFLQPPDDLIEIWQICLDVVSFIIGQKWKLVRNFRNPIVVRLKRTLSGSPNIRPDVSDNLENKEITPKKEKAPGKE